HLTRPLTEHGSHHHDNDQQKPAHRNQPPSSMTNSHARAWNAILYRSAGFGGTEKNHEAFPHSRVVRLPRRLGADADQTGAGRRICTPGEGMDHAAGVHEPAGGSSPR